MVKEGRVKKYVNNFWRQVFWGVLSYPFITAFIYVSAKIAGNILKGSNSSGYLTVKSWVDSSVAFFETYPYQLILGSLFFGILISSVAKLQKKNYLVNSFGINFFSEHDTPKQIRNDWESFVKLIEQEKTQHLCILGATGRDTFQDESSPLFNFVNNFQGDLKVMLLEQQSDMVIERAHAVKVGVADYRKEIGNSITYLKALYKSKSVMKVKTYSDLPNWKIIMTDKYLWLQGYVPGVHVDETPVFGVYRNDSDFSSLYELFFYEFHKSWENGKEISLNSNT